MKNLFKRYFLLFLLTFFLVNTTAFAIYAKIPDGRSEYVFGSVSPGDELKGTVVFGDENWVEGDVNNVDVSLKLKSSVQPPVGVLADYLVIENYDAPITNYDKEIAIDFIVTVPEGLPKGEHEYTIRGKMTSLSSIDKPGISVGVAAGKIITFELEEGSEIIEEVELANTSFIFQDEENLMVILSFNNNGGIEEEIFGDVKFKTKGEVDLYSSESQSLVVCNAYSKNCQFSDLFSLESTALVDKVFFDVSLYYKNLNGDKVDLGVVSYEMWVYPSYLVTLSLVVLGVIILLFIFIKKRKKNVK